MTIKMRLDTDGLRALIASNPELEVEIGKAVLNNITADAVKARVEGQIEACLKGMVKNEGTYYAARYVPVDKGFTTLVNKVVVEAVSHFANEGLKQHVADLAAQAIQKERIALHADLKVILSNLVTPEMAKEIMREKILL